MRTGRGEMGLEREVGRPLEGVLCCRPGGKRGDAEGSDRVRGGALDAGTRSEWAEALIQTGEVPRSALRLARHWDPAFGVLGLSVLRLAYALRGGQTALGWEEVSKVPTELETELAKEMWNRLLDTSALPRSPPAWATALRSSPMVGGETAPAPLMTTRERVGFFRFWSVERKLIQHLRETGLEGSGLWDSSAPAQSQGLDTAGHRLLSKALTRKVTLLCGGPGSGKSSLLAQLVQAYVQRFPGQVAGLQLAAPTARAAKRLEALLKALQNEHKAWEALPAPVTVHRLLSRSGLREFPGSRRPILFWVIDEASMLSSELLLRLLQALPPKACGILAGDGQQLPPVEPGGLLQTVMEQSRRIWAVIPDSPEIDNELGGQALHPCLWWLKGMRRFPSDSGLGRLARAMSKGQLDAVEQLLQAPPDETLSVQTGRLEALSEMLLADYGGYWHALSNPSLPGPDWPALWEAIQGFRALTFGKRGPEGTQALNRVLAQEAARRNAEKGEPVEQGLPLMVTQNQPGAGVVNGDFGLLRIQTHAGTLRRDLWLGEDRRVPLDRLNRAQLQMAFVTSVHKAQGSEFNRVFLILPSGLELTREWLYTGVTRAKQAVKIWGTRERFRQAMCNTSTQGTHFFAEWLQNLEPTRPPGPAPAPIESTELEKGLAF